MVTKRRTAKVSFSAVTFVLATTAWMTSALAAPQTAEGPSAPASAPGAGQADAPEAPPVDINPAANGESAAPATPAAPVAPKAPEGPLSPMPRVYHAAVYSAPPGEPLDLKATFDHPELIRQVVVVVNTAAGAERIIGFKRGDGDQYVAILPAEIMKAPGISYAIEIEHVNGTRVAAFASRTTMHPVTVIEDLTDTRERALLARLGGRRSIITIGGEYVGFGENRGSLAIPCGQNQTTCAPDEEVIPTVNEHYYRIEAGYTYRSLRTVSEFGFRLGVLRGRSLKQLNVYESDRYDVGLNFGAARVRFRLLDLWQFEGELLTSITEEGFSSGFNLATHIGDPYGTKLILGFERLGLTGVTFGNRIYSRMDIVAGNRMLVSPIVEITDMPNARTFGVRLLAELSFKIAGGFSAQVRGGYQARKSDSGGPGVGGSLSYAF
jgi:hypothetical protein